jgi:hypothetical protein
MAVMSVSVTAGFGRSGSSPNKDAIYLYNFGLSVIMKVIKKPRKSSSDGKQQNAILSLHVNIL